jgi:hypothetical protein
MKLFVLAHQSTIASENAGKPGDNALFSCIRELRARNYCIAGTEVSLLPSGDVIPLARQESAIRGIENNLLLVFGSETIRASRVWLPNCERVVVPHQFTFMNEPGRIERELVWKIKEFLLSSNRIYGFNIATKRIG